MKHKLLIMRVILKENQSTSLQGFLQMMGFQEQTQNIELSLIK